VLCEIQALKAGNGRVKAMLTILAAALGATFVFAGVTLVVGQERVWSLFGPPDLGPVAFETLERRTTPNDALACPPHLCRAKSDLDAPVLGVRLNDLRAAMAKVIASEPRTALVYANDVELTERYVQRSALLGFPDTIIIRYVTLPGDRCTLAIYSRSQLGRSDFGANKARIERWLGKLKKEVPLVQ